MAARGIARVLAVVLALIVVVADAPSLHQHRDAGPAWYDEECPLVRLAAGGTGPGLPPVVDLVRPLFAVDGVVPATAPGAAGASRLAISPRGPPIAG